MDTGMNPTVINVLVSISYGSSQFYNPLVTADPSNLPLCNLSQVPINATPLGALLSRIC